MTIVLVSCSANYRVVYYTYTANSESRSLSYEDSRFYFDFLPIPNGVYFKIKNLTNTPAILIWERSYFIKPDNSSSKLLNTDILQESEEIAKESKFESVIAPGVVFARFTTSVLNLEKLSSLNTTQINNYFKNTLITSSIYKEFFTIGRYWPDLGSMKKSKFMIELERIKNYVINNNNLAIVFALKVKDEIIDYRFDFKFKKVEVYRITSKHDEKYGEYKEELEIVSSMDETGEWQWTTWF